MPTWNGVPIPEPPKIKIPSSIPQNFNWSNYASDPNGTFNKFKGAREVNRINWKGYLTNSAKTKQAILSSPSKKVINAAMQQVRSLRKAKKIAENAKKVADAANKVNESLLKKVPGGTTSDKATRIAAIIGVLAAIGVVALLKFQEFVTGRAFDDLSQTQLDLTKVNTTAVNNGLKLKTLETKLQKYEQELSANARDYYKLNKQQESFGKSILDVKKQSNDALYETRQGKTILESKIAESKKQSNDALYETRANKQKLEGEITGIRTSFEAKIQQVNAQISRFNSNVSDTFQRSVNATISKIQSDLAATKAQVNAIRPQTDTNSITANAVAAARALVAPLQAQIFQIGGVVLGVQAQASQIPILGNAVSNLANSVSNANTTANLALAEAKNKGVPNLAPIQQQLDDKFNRFVADNNKALNIRDLQQSNLSKEFDTKLADFNRQSNLTADQRFNEFKKDNDKALGIRDLQQSNLSKEFDAKIADFTRQSNLTADQRFDEFQRTNKESLGLIKKDLQQTTKEVESNKITITKIDTKLGEQAKVNEEALPKLDQILGILPLIPARAADAIRPSIPTIPQIETAAATGTCRTTQPGGCMNKALKDNAADITNNNNTNAANILDAVNTGANAALLTGQQTILSRLGDQVPGGISGFMNRIVKNQWVDRAINLVTMTAAVHNVVMLSDQAATTFFGILDNVLAIPALIVDPNAETIDTKQAFGGLVDGFFKNIFGVTEWAEIKKRWQTANRIYQAAANGANEIRSIGGNIISAVEQTAKLTGKGFNALQDEGLISESNWDYSPENLKLKGGLFAKFGKLADGINIATEGLEAIESITSEIRSAVDSANEIKENAKEVDDGLKELFNQSKTKRDEEIEQITIPSFSEIDFL